MAILGVTCNRSKTISDTRVSVNWELLEYRLFPKRWFLAEIVFSVSGCWKVNGSRWKKEKEKKPKPRITNLPQQQQSFLAPGTDGFRRGLCSHRSITHWRRKDGGKRGFQPASSLPLLPPASPHLPLPTGFSTVFSSYCGSTQHQPGTHTMPMKSRESCKCSWIRNVFFSDSLWIGRSHFSQDGEHLPS